MRLDAFLPSRHGFGFRNRPSVGGELFGLGTPVDAAFALSAGMAWVALDRYLAGRPIAQAAAAPACDDALHAELVIRQSDALSRCGWAMLRDWQRLPERGKPMRPGCAELTHAHWRQLRRSLDGGVPVLLFLVLASGAHADPSTNQAVLAYGYEIDRRTGRVSVRVYDPARPGNDGVRLVFGLGRFRPLEARLAVQTPVRGFFCVSYDRRFPAPLALGDAGALDGHSVDAVFAVQGTDRADGVLELLARESNADAAHDDGGNRLVRIRRRRSGRWSLERINARGAEDRTIEDATMLGRNSMIARTSAGELLEYRRRPGFGWRARSMVERSAEHRPALLQDRAGTSLFACVGGRLMQYRRGRTGAWIAQHIAAGALARTSCQGTPAAARLSRGSLHVLTRTNAGDLMHARWRGKAGWAAENVTARAGDRDRFLVCDDPILLADTHAGRLNVVARSQSGAVLLFRWSARSGWRAQDLTVATGDAGRADSTLSAALDDDGTVHVVARTADCGLLHVWCGRDGTVGAQDLTRTRATITDAGHIDGAPQLVAAPAGALHVFARVGSDLLLYRWAHGADWSVENVSSERGAPRLAHDPCVTLADDAVHVATVDDSGRVHHVCVTGTGSGSSAAGRVRVPAWVADAVALPITVAAVLGRLVTAPARMLAHRSARGATIPANVDDVHNDSDAGADSDAALHRAVVRLETASARPRSVPDGVELPRRAEKVAAMEPDAVGDVARDIAPDVAPDVIPDITRDLIADVAPETSEDFIADVTADIPLDLTSVLAPYMAPDVALPDPASTGVASDDDRQEIDAPPVDEESESTKQQEDEAKPTFDVDEWIMQEIDESPAPIADAAPAPAEPAPPALANEDDWNLPAVEPTAAMPDDDWSLPTPATADATPDDDDWNLPALATPTASPQDEDWNLPVAEPASASTPLPDDWNLPAVEPTDAAASSTDDDWNLPAVEPAPAADDDWNVPPAAQPPRAATPDDWSLPPLEPAPTEDDEAADAPPRRWQNPALAGLPLLDDDAPAQSPSPSPGKPDASTAKPPARRAAKTKKKTSSAEELERVMALADKNRLELLEPD